MADKFNTIRIIIAAASAYSRKILFENYQATILCSTNMCLERADMPAFRLTWKLFHSFMLLSDLGCTSGTDLAVLCSLGIFLAQILMDFPRSAVTHQGIIFLLHVIMWILRGFGGFVQELLDVLPPGDPPGPVARILTPRKTPRFPKFSPDSSGSGQSKHE